MWLGGAAAAMALAGCSGGGSTASWSGKYTVTITNATNDCNFQTWTLGQMVTGVPITMTDDGTAISAEIGDPAAPFFNTALGTNRLSGSAKGDVATLIANGIRPFTEGTCTYSVSATLSLTRSGETVMGTLSYTKTGGAGCEAVQGCASTQSVTGSAPTM
jgi:hypothetical protein